MVNSKRMATVQIARSGLIQNSRDSKAGRPGTAPWVMVGLMATACAGTAQEALRTPEAREATPQALRLRQENQDYFVKWHDIRFQVEPSLTFEWNDNINLGQGAQRQADYIIRPMVDFGAFYPITSWNALRVSMGVGYDEYTKHNEWSQIRLEQRSALEFDFMVSNWRFNVHDRFEDILDPAQEASFAAPDQRFSGLQNMAGATATWWARQNLRLSLGYDHFNFWSSFEDTEYLDRASELPVVRIGYQFLSTLMTGVEATYTSTTYEHPVMNDYSGYSAGVFADWQPGQSLRVEPRAGYVQYDYQQTSLFLKAENQSSWYVGASATHLLTDALSYSISAGHELRPGTYGDSVEDWYVTPSITWKFVKDISLRASMDFQTGKQLSGNVSEDFDWLSASAGVTYQLMKKLSASLNYRHTLRESSVAVREYSQNLVSLSVRYKF